jgi:hypothetical protein
MMLDRTHAGFNPSNSVNPNSTGELCKTMNSVTALMTSHNIVNPNSTGEQCKILHEHEHNAVHLCDPFQLG